MWEPHYAIETIPVASSTSFTGEGADAATDNSDIGDDSNIGDAWRSYDAIRILFDQRNQPYFEFVQNVGDVVVLPARWSYAFVNVQPSASVVNTVRYFPNQPRASWSDFGLRHDGDVYEATPVNASKPYDARFDGRTTRVRATVTATHSALAQFTTTSHQEGRFVCSFRVYVVCAVRAVCAVCVRALCVWALCVCVPCACALCVCFVCFVCMCVCPCFACVISCAPAFTRAIAFNPFFSSGKVVLAGCWCWCLLCVCVCVCVYVCTPTE